MADLTLPPSRIKFKPEWNTAVTTYENRAEQRRNIATRSRPTWTLIYENQTAAELAIFDAFFEAHKGAFASFTWIDPRTSTEHTVRFVDDSYEASPSQRSLQHWNWKVEVVKVL